MKKKMFVLQCLLLSILPLGAQTLRLNENNIDEMIKAMTLEEK